MAGRLNLDEPEDQTPLPLKDQVAFLNALTEHIKHHRPKRSLLDMTRYLKVRGPWER